MSFNTTRVYSIIFYCSKIVWAKKLEEPQMRIDFRPIRFKRINLTESRRSDFSHFVSFSCSLSFCCAVCCCSPRAYKRAYCHLPWVECKSASNTDVIVVAVVAVHVFSLLFSPLLFFRWTLGYEWLARNSCRAVYACIIFTYFIPQFKKTQS